MKLFAQLLREVNDESDITDESTEELPEISDTTDEDIDEEVSTEDVEETVGGIQKKLQDICFSVLDAVESEALAQGETFDEDESVDIGIELLIKLAPGLSDEYAQIALDALSEYYSMDVEESETDDAGDDYFEEPAPEEDDTEYEEDKIKKESIKKKF